MTVGMAFLTLCVGLYSLFERETSWSSKLVQTIESPLGLAIDQFSL